MTQIVANDLVPYFKSKQHHHLGVAPLKEGYIIYCDPMQKANILNRQFISVFTDDTKTSIPDLGPSQYPSIEDITVSCKGVVKLLKNLKPHKADTKGWRFEPQHQYVFSLSKRLYPHWFSRLSCEMSTRWGQPREGCSVLWALRRNSTKKSHIFHFQGCWTWW